MNVRIPQAKFLLERKNIMNRRTAWENIINHRQSDMVIKDLDGCPQSSLEWDCAKMLKEYMGIEGHESLAHNGVDERILQALNIDTRGVGYELQPASPLAKQVSETERIDPWGIRRKFTGLYWDIIESPLRGATVSDLEKYPFPKIDDIDPNEMDLIIKEAKYLYEQTDYIICAKHPVYGVFEMGCWMCGFDDFLLKMALDEEFVFRFFDIFYEYQKGITELYYKELGKYIHYTSSGDDFAMQLNTFMSVDMFDRMIKPYFKDRITLTKTFTDAKFLHHSCGTVHSLIPSLIDAGVDILNPIQPVTDLMSPKTLKNDFGGKIVFHGGLDTQQVLPFGTKETIEKEVDNLLSVMQPNGGYIFAAAHNLQGDVPPENIAAMFKAAEAFGK